MAAVFGRDHDLPHSLVPLKLAVLLVRAKAYGAADSRARDLDGLAAFIAASVPIYEYSDDPGKAPRPLLRSVQQGVFRKSGEELHFLDGKPSKQFLAVHVEDVSGVIEMLKQPHRALHIRSQALRRLARRLHKRAQLLGAQNASVRRTWEALAQRREVKIAEA